MLEVPEFLVRKGLDGRGVDDADIVLNRGADDVFSNGCFSGAGRRADNNWKSFLDVVDRLALEGVINHENIINQTWDFTNEKL